MNEYTMKARKPPNDSSGIDVPFLKSLLVHKRNSESHRDRPEERGDRSGSGGQDESDTDG